jgi:antitoxin MazE
MRVAKWGNSLAVRLPQAVAEILDLKEGDEFDFEIGEDNRVQLKTKLSDAELIERLRRHRGAIPKDFKFDRLDANRRG